MKLKNWHLLIILIPLLFITATLLRFDHIKMVELRDAVLAADEDNDQDALISNLNALREFAFSHTIINISEKNGAYELYFGTGPFYLEHTYRRDAEAIKENAKHKLSKLSRTINDVSDSSVILPSTELYRFNFASPILSFTPAGIMIVLCAALIVVIFIRIIISVISDLSLSTRKKR